MVKDDVDASLVALCSFHQGLGHRSRNPHSFRLVVSPVPLKSGPLSPDQNSQLGSGNELRDIAGTVVEQIEKRVLRDQAESRRGERAPEGGNGVDRGQLDLFEVASAREWVSEGGVHQCTANIIKEPTGQTRSACRLRMY